jgi:hypothetical protein
VGTLGIRIEHQGDIVFISITDSISKKFQELITSSIPRPFMVVMISQQDKVIESECRRLPQAVLKKWLFFIANHHDAILPFPSDTGRSKREKAAYTPHMKPLG